MTAVLRNATNEELIVEARTTDDPLIRELGERLADLEDTAPDIEALQEGYDERIEQMALRQETLEEDLKTAREEVKMLEQQIEELRAAQDQTNGLLTEILTTLREGSVTLPEPVQAAKKVPVNDAGGKKKPAKAGAKPKPDVTVDDVRDALMDVRDSHGRDAATTIIRDVVGDGAPAILRSIPQGNYPDVIAACKALNQKEAA